MGVADAADADEEAAAEEAVAEEKRAPMEMCSRGSITSTIATCVAMTATTQDTNAPTPTETTTCQTSNAMRPIYMHIRVRAWWHNINPSRMAKDAEWDGSWRIRFRKHNSSWIASNYSANKMEIKAANSKIGKDPTIINNKIGDKPIGNRIGIDR